MKVMNIGSWNIDKLNINNLSKSKSRIRMIVNVNAKVMIYKGDGIIVIWSVFIFRTIFNKILLFYGLKKQHIDQTLQHAISRMDKTLSCGVKNIQMCGFKNIVGWMFKIMKKIKNSTSLLKYKEKEKNQNSCIEITQKK